MQWVLSYKEKSHHCKTQVAHFHGCVPAWTDRNWPQTTGEWATRLVEKYLGWGGSPPNHFQVKLGPSTDSPRPHLQVSPGCGTCFTCRPIHASKLASLLQVVRWGSGRSHCFYDFSVCMMESTANTSVILQQFKHGTRIPKRTAICHGFFPHILA